MARRIDAHQHFWQLDKPFNYQWLQSPDLAAICRDYLPDDLLPHLQQTGIEQSIFVQTQHDLEENRWVLGLAEQHSFLAGVVGWVDLASPDCESQVEEFASQPLFVGVRHITQDEPDDNFIVRPDIINGLRILEKHAVPFDLLFFEKHLPHAATLADSLPDLPMVIDHLSKPGIKAGSFDAWQQHLQAAAAFPNVYCKLSGMITEADWENWKPADLRPYVESALEFFGPQRCMYGSDWPVCELAGSYEQVYGALAEIVGDLSESEQDQIFGETAAKFYRLEG